jgi:ubiquitin carboxyl-terminal hydrolase 25
MPTPLEQDLPPPPPLPARPSPAPPSRSRDQPVVTVDAVPEPSETASNVSSQTLINHADAEEPMPDSPSDMAQPSVEIDDSQSAGMLTQEDPLKTISDAKGSVAFDLRQAEPIDSVKVSLDNTSTALDGVVTPGETAPEIAATIEKLSPEPEMTTEQKLTKALDNQTIHGTDQEDVEEVMGKIIHHLHAAIRPTAVDTKTHAQTDQIVETFYCNTINHTKKNNEATYRSEVVMERWLSAFPAETGPSGLYEALDRNFDQQFIDADTERFTSIKELPPILHVHLQRTAPNGRKNENPIVIPEELFLDRYMDDGYKSTLFAKRKRGWNLKRRLAAFDESPPGTSPGTTAKEQDKQNQDIPDGLLDDFVGIEKIFDFPETTDDGFDIIDPQLAQLLDANGIRRPTRQNETTPPPFLTEPSIDDLDPELAKDFVKSLKSQKEQAQAELDSLFEGMTKYKYRLHAVICHGGGQSTSGHYWVWIYDFEQGIWRKYNDTRVTEDPDSTSVLRMLSSKGEPYYLAYVRDEDKERWVDIPLRMRPQPQAQNVSPGQAQNAETSDVEMQDVSMPVLVPNDDITQPQGAFNA